MMKIDLVIDGMLYASKPYVGSQECFDCALKEMCDNAEFPKGPCSLFEGKVIFCEKGIFDREPIAMTQPMIGDTIQILSVSCQTKIKAGNTYEVLASGTKDGYVFIGIRLEGKMIHNYYWGDIQWKILSAAKR